MNRYLARETEPFRLATPKVEVPRSSATWAVVFEAFTGEVPLATVDE